MDGQQPRSQMKDPRLAPSQGEPLGVLAFYGRMAGWAGSVLLLAALFWASIAHTINRTPIKVLGILGLLCVAFWLYSNIHQLVVAVRTRGFQTALSSALFTVCVLGILVAVNYIGGRHDVLRHDFTKNKQYSLSDATKSVIGKLDRKVKITAFVSDEAYNAEDLRRLLREYQLNAAKITVDTYDFKTALDKVQEYGARFDGTMYVEAGEGTEKRKEEIQGGTEEQITSAILAATTGQKTRICFLTGHGEAGLDSGGAADKPTLSTLKGVLDNQQYQCDSLNLMTQKAPAVPGDCKLLVIAGARYAPTPAEMQAITRYVDQAGNLFLMLEPGGPDFADLLKSHGVTPLPAKVTDAVQSAEGRPEILATTPQGHDLTRGLQVVVLPTSMAFDVESSAPPPSMPGAPPPPDNQKAVGVLQTSDAATLAGQTGRRGPFKVAVAIDESPKPPPQNPGEPPAPQPEDSTRKARLLVVGDSDFATDGLLPALGGYGRQNLAFAAMGVNWLVKNEKLVAVPPKEPAEKPFSVTDSQKRLTWVITIGIVPLLIVIAGALMWWTRRRV
jgi:hypothetical protein